MSGGIRSFEVDDIAYAFAPQDWPFARDAAAAIDAHWAELRTARSGIFDGEVLIAHGWQLVRRGGRQTLEAACMPCSYRAFLAWRDFGFPDTQVWNLFAMAALRSADGAFMVGCMGADTANAGRVYFPAGTPDLGDVRGSSVDLLGSVTRELLEETGLATTDADIRPGWTILIDGQRIACMKQVRSPLTAAELLRRFDLFQASQREPELSGLEAVWPAPHLADDRMPPFMLRYLRTTP